jgi:hypothetical protein
MTLWEQFVKSPREQARFIQEHGSHGNIETQISYEVLMAQASAAEQVLRQRNDRLPETLRPTVIGLPEEMSCGEALSELHSGTSKERFQAAAHIQGCTKCQAKISDAQNPGAALTRDLLSRLDKR